MLNLYNKFFSVKLVQLIFMKRHILINKLLNTKWNNLFLLLFLGSKLASTGEVCPEKNKGNSGLEKQKIDQKEEASESVQVCAENKLFNCKNNSSKDEVCCSWCKTIACKKLCSNCVLRDWVDLDVSNFYVICSVFHEKLSKFFKLFV